MHAQNMYTTVLAQAPGHEVAGVVGMGWECYGWQQGFKKRPLILYIKYSTVSVLLTVLVLLPKPNYDVVVMSHPQRQ